MKFMTIRHKVVTGALIAAAAFGGAVATAGPADAAATDFNPDVSVAFTKNGLYAGDNSEGGEVTRRVKRNKPKAVFFKIQNDGGDPGNVTVAPDPGDGDLKLKYFLGKNRIPPELLGDLDFNLAGGASRTIRVVIKAKPGFTDTTFGVFAEDAQEPGDSDFMEVFVDVKPFQV